MTQDITLAPPRTVACLGYGGLIPFLSLTTASLLDRHHAAVWSDALYGYAAIILSFVGALHWGLAMGLPGLTDSQRSTRFIWSVVPALIAWPALLFSPPIAGPLLLAGFIAHFLQDRRLSRQATLPDWYLPLRLRLSSVACICLVTGAFAYCG